MRYQLFAYHSGRYRKRFKLYTDDSKAGAPHNSYRKKKKRSAHVKKLDYIGRVTVKNQKSQGKANDPGKHLHIH